MLPLTKGRYTARQATSRQDIDRAQSLRHLCFNVRRGLVTATSDADTFDDLCQHIVVEDTKTATVLCCFRLMHFATGARIGASYSAQFYDLIAFATYPYPMLELGRFCIHPDCTDPDILRVAWGAITKIVDETGVHLLFGCTSFDGADPAKYRDALALLKDRHLAPAHLHPGQKSPNAHLFAALPPDHTSNHGLANLPPLLRSYLLMGGWVSDHAVIDISLNTLHVFTGLEVENIPVTRARALRSIAGECHLPR